MIVELSSVECSLALGPLGIAIAAQAVGAGISALSQWWTNRSQQRFAASQGATSYQRAVRDMQRAGLNPMLAYQQGGAPSMSISPRNPAEGLAGVAHSAMQLRNETLATQSNAASQFAQRDLAYEQQELIRAQASKTLQDIDVSKFGLSRDKEVWAKTKQAQIAMYELANQRVRSEIGLANSAVRQRQVEIELAMMEKALRRYEVGKVEALDTFGERFGGEGFEWFKYLPGALLGAGRSGARRMLP